MDLLNALPTELKAEVNGKKVKCATESDWKKLINNMMYLLSVKDIQDQNTIDTWVMFVAEKYKNFTLDEILIAHTKAVAQELIDYKGEVLTVYQKLEPIQTGKIMSLYQKWKQSNHAFLNAKQKLIGILQAETEPIIDKEKLRQESVYYLYKDLVEMGTSNISTLYYDELKDRLKPLSKKAKKRILLRVEKKEIERTWELVKKRKKSYDHASQYLSSKTFKRVCVDLCRQIHVENYLNKNLNDLTVFLDIFKIKL